MLRPSAGFLFYTTLCFGLVAGPGQAAQLDQSAPPLRTSGSIPQPEPRVTVSLSQKPLGTILYAIFHQTPYRYQLRAQVGAELFSLDVTRVPLGQALSTLFEHDTTGSPITYAFVPASTNNPGTFVIDREYLQVGDTAGEHRVSATRARLTHVLSLVFKAMKARFRIEPDVPQVTVTLQLRPRDWSECIGEVLVEASKEVPGLTYSLDGDTYVIFVQKTGPAGGAAVRRVTLTLESVSLREAIGRILSGSQYRYRVSDAVGEAPINYKATDQPEMEALREVLKRAADEGTAVTYRDSRGVLLIEPGPLPGRLGTTASLHPASLRAVTLSADRQRLRVVVRTLAAASGASIKVAPTVPDIRVTFDVKNGTVDEALRALLDAARVHLPNLALESSGERAFLLSMTAEAVSR